MVDEPENLKGKELEVEKGRKTEEEQGRGEEDVGEKKEKGGRAEDKRRVGRPTKKEILRRERTNSLPIVKLFKRGKKKKERQEEKNEVEELEAFKKSTRV